jgi:primosomal protein N' (replication factor Y)
VISSSGDHVREQVPDRPSIVVATVGAEPVAPAGYAAALLLDGDALLRRESLRASEDAIRRWFNAAALVRPAREGGTVVLVSSATDLPGYVVRWDPAAFAERELALRQELGLPPAVRIASLTGPEAAVALFTAEFKAGPEVRVVGPAPLDAPRTPGESIPHMRTLLFFPYAAAGPVTARLRAVKAALAARRNTEPVQVRCDGVDVL